MRAALIQVLHTRIVSVCPIEGVSIGDWLDKATWRVDYKLEATQTQREAAQAVIAGFDPNMKPLVELTVEDVLNLLKTKGVLTQKDVDDAKVAKG